MLATSFIATEGVNVGAASKFIIGDLLAPIAFPSSACPYDVDKFHLLASTTVSLVSSLSRGYVSWSRDLYNPFMTTFCR